MRIKTSKDNIIFLEADTQYELASTFMRLQEHYESPKFRGKQVDLEDYMDWYAKEYGNFTYYSDWNGFNVPGNVVRKFLALHCDGLLSKEETLLDLLKPWIEGDEKFYVIGVWQNDNTIDHEISHALYYLDPAYKKQQTVALNGMDKLFRSRIATWLKKKGYHPSVTDDETIAYLSTNTMADSVHYWKSGIPWDTIAPFQVNFYKRYGEYKDDKKS